MTISKEQMDRIRRHINGDKSEAMGAWILDKNALNLALERVAELEAAIRAIGDAKTYEHDDEVPGAIEKALGLLK